ncbi:MAG: hypothetical protein GX993_01685 [Bacteroidales bacterium]|nr:hypothetical protein [Bacteroidales bacterium]
MSELETRELRETILLGLDISFQRLVQEKRQDNSELAFARKGQIVRIKADDI